MASEWIWIGASGGKVKIHLVQIDDWIDILDSNGNKIYGGHSIRPNELLSLLNIEYEQYWFEYDKEEEAYWEFHSLTGEEALQFLQEKGL